MSSQLTLTAVFTPDEGGWTMAQLAEWPAVVTCGPPSTRPARCSSTPPARCWPPTATRAASHRSADTLDYLARRREPRDALTEFLDQATIDDEPVSEEEERAVQEARDEIASGQTISLEQIKRELQ